MRGEYFEKMVRRLASLLGGKRSIAPSNLLIGLFLVAILALFLVPLSPHVLDILLVANIAIAVSLLLHSMFVAGASANLAFPTILLLSTLFRLALNVSSTRLILLYGDQGLHVAGKVIQAFGNFVVQGDFVVGAIIFAVIAVVNFTVIAKGSARVAEVAARFALDSLPGKQLAIDSDARAGSIDFSEASHRRRELIRESQFYGAMDGAMRFVQGDAIAGLVIAFINAVGGVSLGLSRGMDFSDAVSSFGVLTIGDGLVSIIPSLLISVCAGLVVTHNARDTKDSSSDVKILKMLSDPQTLIVTSVILISLGLLPGFPLIPFTIISVLSLGVALKIKLRTVSGKGASETGVRAKRHEALSFMQESYVWDDKDDSCGEVIDLLMEVDHEVLSPYLREIERAGLLAKAFRKEKELIYEERGVIIPETRIKVASYLSAGSYRISIRGGTIRSGHIDTENYFVSWSSDVLKTFGVAVEGVAKDPVTRQLSSWVNGDWGKSKVLESAGCSVLPPYQYLAKEVFGTATELIEELFGVEETKLLIHIFSANHRDLLSEVLTEGGLSVPELADILRRLLKDCLSIRDFKLLCEGILEYSANHSLSESEDRGEWKDALHQHLRGILARGVWARLRSERDHIAGFTVSYELEREIVDALPFWDRGKRRVPLEPESMLKFSTAVRNQLVPIIERGSLPFVIVCGEEIRPLLQELVYEALQIRECVRTVSYDELALNAQIESLGVIGI